MHRLNKVGHRTAIAMLAGIAVLAVLAWAGPRQPWQSYAVALLCVQAALFLLGAFVLDRPRE